MAISALYVVWPGSSALAAPGGDATTVVHPVTWAATSGTDTVMCPPGTRAIGGGAAPVSPDALTYKSRLHYSAPVDSSGGAGSASQGDVPAGWTVTVGSSTGDPLGAWKVFVTCSASSDAVLETVDTNGATLSYQVSCPSGSRAIGGGLADLGGGSAVLTRNGPRDGSASDFGHSADGSVPTRWRVEVLDPAPSARAVAVCSAGSDATLRGANLTVTALGADKAQVATVGCPAGQRAVSGGLAADATQDGGTRVGFAAPVATLAELSTIATGATPQAWTLQGRGGGAVYTAYAVCITQPPPADTTPPETTIDKGPKKRTTSRKARFTFSSEAGATFLCLLDRKPAKACASPFKVKKLKVGKHHLSVIAKDAAGNVERTPATYKWKVVKKPKPRPPSGCTGECRGAPSGYTTYVACSTRASAKPATECRLSQTSAAFFVSTKQDATYKVCVKFPGRKKRLCAGAQPADKGEATFVTIATASTGKHKVRWYVAGKKVGSWAFGVV